jgi:hypothetical protein
MSSTVYAIRTIAAKENPRAEEMAGGYSVALMSGCALGGINRRLALMLQPARFGRPMQHYGDTRQILLLADALHA